MASIRTYLVGLTGLLLGAPGSAAAAQQQDSARTQESSLGTPAVSGSFVEDTVQVELSLTPVGDTAAADAAEIVQDRDVDVRVTITHAESGAPLSGLYVAAWIDRRNTIEPTPVEACHEKIEGYVRGTLQVRPAADLNSYFVLALNNGNNISVIDPFLGFGSSKLYTTVLLRSVGDDWALDTEHDRLFVTMPLVNQVAVVSTVNWKVQKNLDVGTKPTRIVLQPDGRYLWVANDGVAGTDGGVTVIDAATAEVVSQISTGDGSHAFAFIDGVTAGLSDNGEETRLAFVTNKENGTLSVVDVASLTKLVDIKTGPAPVDVAYSVVGRALYVVHEGDGSILVIDAASTELRARIGSSPGLAAIEFDFSGRWGFVVNGTEDELYIVDASTATVRHAVSVPEGPDQVSFTRSFGYVRSTGSVDVTMIQLSRLEDEGEVVLQAFPTGQVPPAQFGDPGTAPAIASAAGPTPLPGLHPRAMEGRMGDAVYVSNPADKSIYYYHYMEGMPTPSGRLHNYGFEPKAALVVGRHLRETEPGVFTTTMIAPHEGEYDAVFLLDDPRMINCFDFAVAADPTRENEAPLSLRVEPLWGESPLSAGEPLELQFRLTELTGGEAQIGVEDLWVLVYSTSGRRVEGQAVHLGDGVYRATLTVPTPGVYYVAPASRSLRLRVERQVPATLRVESRE